MTRQIIFDTNSRGTKARSETKKPTPDDYVTKITKYIPSETIAAYIVANSLVKSLKVADGLQPFIYLTLLIVFAAGTYFYLRKAGVTMLMQLIMSIIAFLIWTISIDGGLFQLIKYDQGPLVGSLLAVIFTFLAPLVPPMSSNE